MQNTATLTVNLDALAANYNLLRSKLNKRFCAAVVKANAYGLGVEKVSQRLWAEGCRQFFVATLAEAIELKQALPRAKQIYIFQGPLPGEAKEILQRGFIPLLNSTEQVARWKAEANGASSALHIDTGMTRLGLNETEALAWAQDHEALKACGIQCIMSHLACANDGDEAKSADQLARFKKALAAFPQPMAACLANSAGIFLGSDYHWDMARPGCALYGINPIPGKNPMTHVATLSAPIISVRALDRDETVGYGATHNAPKGARIAIVALGYADGFARSLSSTGVNGFIAGQKAPVIGRVSMDMIALDVSSIPESAINDKTRVELINETQTVNDIADFAGTIGYEVFTSIGRRVMRQYI